jgi:hypothetical protein
LQYQNKTKGIILKQEVIMKTKIQNIFKSYNDFKVRYNGFSETYYISLFEDLKYETIKALFEQGIKFEIEPSSGESVRVKIF